jgi:hypothetical protein
MRYLSRPSLLAGLVLLAPHADLTAQASTPLSPGMRVRVTVATLPSATGTVVESTDSEFRFAREGSPDTITVVYSNVTRLDMSQGMHNRVAHDAIWGAGMGAALGAVVGAFSDRSDPRYSWDVQDSVPSYCSVVNPECQSNPGRTEHHPPFLNRTMTGLGIGALAGAAVGALYGHFRKTEIWETLPPEKYHVHMAVAPTWGGARVQLRIAM